MVATVIQSYIHTRGTQMNEMSSFNLSNGQDRRLRNPANEHPMATWGTTARPLYDALASALASGGASSKAEVWELVDGLRGDHRTSQSNVIRCLLETIVTFAALDPGTDARNDGAVDRCKRIAELLKDDDGFPLI